MCPTNLPDDDAISPEDLARIIATCDRFEAEWNAGRPLRIEDELALTGEPKLTRFLRELLALEIELTKRDGRHADPNAYLARFPGQSGTVLGVFAGQAATASYHDVTGPVVTEEPTSLRKGYELLRKLGEGGQATTYLARDCALQRLVWL